MFFGSSFKPRVQEKPRKGFASFPGKVGSRRISFKKEQHPQDNYGVYRKRWSEDSDKFYPRLKVALMLAFILLMLWTFLIEGLIHDYKDKRFIEANYASNKLAIHRMFDSFDSLSRYLHYVKIEKDGKVEYTIKSPFSKFDRHLFGQTDSTLVIGSWSGVFIKIDSIKLTDSVASVFSGPEKYDVRGHWQIQINSKAFNNHLEILESLGMPPTFFETYSQHLVESNGESAEFERPVARLAINSNITYNRFTYVYSKSNLDFKKRKHGKLAQNVYWVKR